MDRPPPMTGQVDRRPAVHRGAMRHSYSGISTLPHQTTDRATAGSSHPAASATPATSMHTNGVSPTGTIPDIVIRRLPVYVRTLRAMRDQGIPSVSSDELAQLIGVTAAQIRRDLSYFGRFGKQGKGYDTGYLADRIASILGVDETWDVALAGIGNLGQAVLHYRGFTSPTSSFKIVALFDRGAHGTTGSFNGLPILSTERMADVIRQKGIRVGIIAVPAAAAQDIADRMIAGGIKALLNYAPVVLRVPPDVTVREIDPVSALQSMTYYLTER